MPILLTDLSPSSPHTDAPTGWRFALGLLIVLTLFAVWAYALTAEEPPCTTDTDCACNGVVVNPDGPDYAAGKCPQGGGR